MPKNIHNYLIYIEIAGFVIILQVFTRLMKIILFHILEIKILFIYKKQKRNLIKLCICKHLLRIDIISCRC